MDGTIGQNSDRITGIDPVQRSAALADARHRASETALQSAEAGETRKAEQREMVRSILERAVGANTRLSIARNESALTFVYRAIDIDTGEIVREWPPVDFARLLEQNGVGPDLSGDALAGLVLDEQA